VGMDYEPLPVVVDPVEAAKDTTVLHPDHGSNTALAFELGSLDRLFDGCEVVVTQQMVNQRVAPAPLEVRSSACAWGPSDGDGAGRLTFWASTQSPHGARDTIATALGLDPSKVHFIAPDVGGGFGAKFGVSIEDLLLAVLAQRLGRPMRWTETRTENMLSMGHGRAQLQTFREADPAKNSIFPGLLRRIWPVNQIRRDARQVLPKCWERPRRKPLAFLPGAALFSAGRTVLRTPQ